MNGNSFRRALLFSLMHALAAGSAWAQSAAFTGTVLDTSGAAVAGAKVTITNEANGATRTATTESDGKYLFTQLAPGKYKMEVKAQGFKTAVRQHLEFLVGITSTVDLRIDVGAVSETVTVEAQVAALNTTDASMGNPVSGSELSALPILDMNPAGLLGLQTGVSYIPSQADNPGGYGGTTEDDGRSGAVNGARSDQTNVTLDGVDVNDPQKGYAFTSVLRVPGEALAEFPPPPPATTPIPAAALPPLRFSSSPKAAPTTPTARPIMPIAMKPSMPTTSSSIGRASRSRSSAIISTAAHSAGRLSRTAFSCLGTMSV